MQAAQLGQRDESQQDVLVDTEAQQAVGRIRREPREAAHLGAGQVTLIYAYNHGGVAGLLLLNDVAFEPAVVLRIARAVGANDRQQRALTERLRMRLISAE